MKAMKKAQLLANNTDMPSPYISSHADSK